MKRKHLEIMEGVKKNQNRKQFHCQECNLAFYHRKGLNIHRKIHESAAADVAKEKKECDEVPVVRNQSECTAVERIERATPLDDLLARYGTPQTYKKKGRKVFITDRDFDLGLGGDIRQSVVQWEELSHDCIYKLDLLYRYDNDQKIGADLSSRDGVCQSVILPEFVIEKLLELTQQFGTVYLRPIGDCEQVSIVAVKTHICINCNTDFSTAKTLWTHKKNHCKN